MIVPAADVVKRLQIRGLQVSEGACPDCGGPLEPGDPDLRPWAACYPCGLEYRVSSSAGRWEFSERLLE